MTEVTVSTHALSRMSQRAQKGMCPINMAQEAYNNGWRYHELGPNLQAYIDKKREEHPECVRYVVYGGHIWAFDATHLVTLLSITKKSCQIEYAELKTRKGL